MKEKILNKRKYTYEQLFSVVGGGGNYLHIKNGLYDYKALSTERWRQNIKAKSLPGNGKFCLLKTMKKGYVTIGQRY
jgi:hypothetical protein|nr:MAG TPA: hypothetical protein [Caudoviricetes sp.]